jgi:hypothetical protein
MQVTAGPGIEDLLRRLRRNDGGGGSQYFNGWVDGWNGNWIATGLCGIGTLPLHRPLDAAKFMKIKGFMVRKKQSHLSHTFPGWFI